MYILYYTQFIVKCIMYIVQYVYGVYWGGGEGGPTPKKCMKREGNKVSIFKIEKIPIFAHGAPKFGFGDGKKCEKMGKKVYGKRGKKYSF